MIGCGRAMLRLRDWWTLTGGLSLAFALMIGVINSHQADDSALNALVTEPCAMPCWQGIVPGESEVTRAIRILQTHPWVMGLDLSSPTITWAWSGQQPGYIDSTRRGSLATRWDRVISVMIPTRLTFGEVLLAFEQPLEASYVALRGTPYIVHTAVYQEFALYSRLSCPIHVGHIWTQPVSLIMEHDLIDHNRRIADFVNYDAPQWRREISVCQR